MEDVLAGNYDGSSDGSSSSSEVSSGTMLHFQPQKSFWIMESATFQRIFVAPIPSLLHLPMILDKVDLSSFNRGVKRDFAATSDNAGAIVPYQPTLHDVLIQLWASALTSPTAQVEQTDSENQTTDLGFPLIDQNDSQTFLSSDSEMPEDSLEVAVPAKKCLTPLLDVVSSSTAPPLPPRPDGKMSLAPVISKSKPNKPLSSLGSRRSPRLNSTEGYQFV